MMHDLTLSKASLKNNRSLSLFMLSRRSLVRFVLFFKYILQCLDLKCHLATYLVRVVALIGFVINLNLSLMQLKDFF